MATFLRLTLPVSVVGVSGATGSLADILSTSFGTGGGGYKDFWLTYYGAATLQGWDFSYWNVNNPAVATWSIAGQDIGPDFANQKHVTLAQVGSALFHAGNDIGPLAYVMVPVAYGNGPNTAPTEYIQYSIMTIAPGLQSATAANGSPTPADVVAAAQRFAATYVNVPNDNDCHFIDAAVAAAAGATLTDSTQSLDPTQNEEGGFWRIAYRGSDPNPVANWQTLVQPGDIVRMGWTAGGQHTTLVLQKNPNGSIQVYDNAGFNGLNIGIHNTNYDTKTIATTVTIYRVSSDHLYLMNGTAANETLAGTIYSDKIFGHGGNDSIDGGAGANVAGYLGARSEYDLRTSLGTDGLLHTRLADQGGAGDGTDTLTHVAQAAFADHTFSLDGAQLNHISNVAGMRFDDVLFQNSANGQVLYASMWGGGFNGWGTATGALGAGWQAVASGDVNPGATGGAETFVQNTANGTIYYASRDSGAITWGVVSTSLTADWKLRAVADLNGDASADAIVQNQLNGTTYYADLKGGVFQGWHVVNQDLTGDWKAVGAGDLNGDGFADVVVQNGSTGTTYYANMVNGAFAGWGTVSVNLAADWNVKAVADVTGDGFADVIIQQASIGTTYYADMKNGVLDHWGVVTTSVTGDWVVEGVADVDNDGFRDVILQNSGDGTTYYARMGPNGFGGWGAVATNITSEWHVV